MPRQRARPVTLHCTYVFARTPVARRRTIAIATFISAVLQLTCQLLSGDPRAIAAIINFNHDFNPHEAAIYLAGTTAFSAAAASRASPPAVPPAPTPAAAFYVAPNGSDRNPGTLAAPFATLARAQHAMQTTSIKITYVKAGTYHLTSSLLLTSADNGETFQYYPGSGVDTAILDGGSTNGTNGVQIGIDIEGGNNITIDGLQLQHFAWLGIGDHGGAAFYATFYNATGQAYGNTIINNSIHDIYGSAATDGFGGGIGICGQVANTTINNNVIYNVDAFGIAAHSGYRTDNDTIENLSIQNNAVFNTGLTRGAVATRATNKYQLGDFGAIYVQDDTGPQSGGLGSTGIIVKNNYIRDAGTNFVKGIYLDDGCSNATVTGNIVTGHFNYAVDYHSGANNKVYNNIFDLGTSGTQYLMMYQNQGAAGYMLGNTFTNNIVIGNFAGSGSTGDVFYAGYGNSFVLPTIWHNVYWNYSGGTISVSGYIGDISPTIENPMLSGWTYTIAAGSPVFNGPVSFAPIDGGWGPPGFVIAETGTRPSYGI